MNIRHTNQLRWAINFQNTGRLAYNWDAWDCKTTAAKLAEQRLFSNLIPFSNSQSRGYFLSQGTMHFQTFDIMPRIFYQNVSYSSVSSSCFLFTDSPCVSSGGVADKVLTRELLESKFVFDPNLTSFSVFSDLT